MLVAVRVAIRASHDQKNPARVPLARPIWHVAIIKASVMLHCFFKGLPKMGAACGSHKTCTSPACGWQTWITEESTEYRIAR
jgi:hypothetical protein